MKREGFLLFRPVNFLRGRHNRFTIATTFGATAVKCLELFFDEKGGIFIVGGPPWVKGKYGTSVPDSQIRNTYCQLITLAALISGLPQEAENAGELAAYGNAKIQTFYGS